MKLLLSETVLSNVRTVRLCPGPARSHLKSPAPNYFFQLALQSAAVCTALLFTGAYYAIRGEAVPWWGVISAIGGMAWIFASMARQPWWWKLIHAIFVPMACAVSFLKIPAGWFFVAFLAALFIFRGALQGRIPLFLSNTATTRALAKIIGNGRKVNFLDLGAGLGSVVSGLAKSFPDAQFAGVENAPLTWLIGRLRTARLPNCEWLWGDLWRADLSRFDVIYAFLSPTPMAELWKKVVREMRPGSTFISNTFAVPGVQADQIIEVGDSRRTRLYCYQIADIKDESRCEPPRPSPESGSLLQAP